MYKELKKLTLNLQEEIRDMPYKFLCIVLNEGIKGYLKARKELRQEYRKVRDSKIIQLDTDKKNSLEERIII